MNSVGCFGMLCDNRRHLDSGPPTLPKLSCNSTSREKVFSRPVSTNNVDSFGLLYGNRRRLDGVQPHLSGHSTILSLLPPRISTPSPSIPEQHERRLPSKLTAFISKVKKTLSGQPKLQKLPEKVPCVATPSPELAMRPQELPSKGLFAGMPSEKLVVIQIIHWNHQQQYGGSKPLLFQGQSKTSPSSSRIASFPVFKGLIFDGRKKSAALAESQAQGFEIDDSRNKLGEVAAEADRGALNEVNGGDTAHNKEGDGRNCSTFSTFEASADNSITGQKIGGSTGKDNEGDGKECSDSSRPKALTNDGSVAHKIETGNTTNESEEDRKDGNDTSRSNALSTNEIIGHQIEDDGTANTNKGKGEDDSHGSASNQLPAKEDVAVQCIDEIVTANTNEGKEGAYGDHAADTVFDKENVIHPIDGASSAKDSPETVENWIHPSTSDGLFDVKKNAHQVDDGDTASNDEEDRKEDRDTSSNDTLSEPSSGDESDGGVAIGIFQESWEESSKSSRLDRLSDKDTAHQDAKGNAVEDAQEKPKDSTDSSTSDKLTAEESIQPEDASDEVEADAEANRILYDDSRSLPSERDLQSSSEIEAAVDGADDDSVDTSSEKENISPSVLPSSITGLQYDSNRSGCTRDDNGNIENSHLSSGSSSDSSVDEGPWVMGVDHHGDLQAHHVSPVSFNVRELRASENTPSIESRESELDDTSPLFQKPSAPVKKPTSPDQPRPSTSGKAGDVQYPTASLNIWRDGSSNASPAEKPTLRRKPGRLFKDVSNTRQLLRNVQATKVDRDPVKETEKVNQMQDNGQRTPYLQISVPYVQPPLTSSHAETPRDGGDSSESTWEPGKDPVRAAHFAATLAALEGDVSPKPGTPQPLIRCARQEYGPDVLLDWPRPPLHHPKPTRPWIGGQTIAKLEKQVASAPRIGTFAVTRPQMRPGNRAEGLVRPKNAYYGLREQRRDTERQFASPSWTSFFAKAKPQITRPGNPTPDAARYHHMNGC